MTEKELLYVEDAIGHETNIIAMCELTIGSLEDEKLVSFLEKEVKGHKTMKDKLMKMLEVKANE